MAAQEELAGLAPPPWPITAEVARVAGCFVCFERGQSGPGSSGDRGWAAAVLAGLPAEPVTSVVARAARAPAATVGARSSGTVTRVVAGSAGAPYKPGLLGLREGPLLEAALLALPGRPDLLVVNGTGRDHPRRAGLALYLGARLAVPSVGVTNRPLVATGELPGEPRGATSPLRIGDEIVANWVRTRRGTAPLVAHPGWQTDPDQAVELLLALTPRWRTPLPLRLARQAARQARSS